MNKLVLENIVLLLSDGQRIAVLDKEGNTVSRFRLPVNPDSLFQKNNLIYSNTSEGLFCYDIFGKELWRETDCYSGSKNPITFDNDGFYVANSVLRNEVDFKKDCRHLEVLGKTFYNTKPDQTDLWCCKISFIGKIEWHKYIADNCESYGDILFSNRRLVLPFLRSISPDVNSTGFHILDNIGNTKRSFTIDYFSSHPMNIVDNNLVYRREFDNEENKKRISLEVFDLKTLEQSFGVAYDSSRTDKITSVIGDRLFITSPRLVRVFDLKNKRLLDINQPNYGAFAIDDVLIVNEADPEYLKTKMWNPVGLGKISGYDRDFNKLWQYDLPERLKDKRYFLCLLKDGILLDDGTGLFKISSDGKLQWQRDPIKTVNAIESIHTVAKVLD